MSRNTNNSKNRALYNDNKGVLSIKRCESFSYNKDYIGLVLYNDNKEGLSIK